MSQDKINEDWLLNYTAGEEHVQEILDECRTKIRKFLSKLSPDELHFLIFNLNNDGGEAEITEPAEFFLKRNGLTYDEERAKKINSVSQKI